MDEERLSRRPFPAARKASGACAPGKEITMDQGESEGKGRLKAVAVIAIVTFLAGGILGYYIWGYRGHHPPDYKEMLRQTISYISALEEKNRELASRVSGLENETASLKKRLGEVPAQGVQDSARTAEREREYAELKAKAQERDELLKENQLLRERVRSLVEELHASGRQQGAANTSP